MDNLNRKVSLNIERHRCLIAKSDSNPKSSNYKQSFAEYTLNRRKGFNIEKAIPVSDEISEEDLKVDTFTFYDSTNNSNIFLETPRDFD